MASVGQSRQDTSGTCRIEEDVGRILVGTASWTDPTLIASGQFYPPEVKSAEAMLRFYASKFSLVEIDSTYYSMPAERNSYLWVERTPDDFTFDVKAFALMTTHPAEVRSLPSNVRELLPADILDKGRVYARDLPSEAVDLVWQMFESALRPLHNAGKLGAVFLQFPKWFPISRANKEYILDCKARLPDYRIAVEFRQSTWLRSDNVEETLDFLESNDLAYTAVDAPQGFASSIPPIAPVTSDEIAVVRMHGRNAETWEKPGLKPSDRFKYLYAEGELREWVPKVRGMARQAKEVHILFNNNYSTYAVTNASQMNELLAGMEE
jgi:uncharacterized protein YecE (DUF72 family)